MSSHHSNSNRRISVYLFVLICAAAVALTVGCWHFHAGDNERVLFWCVVLPWAAVARFPGTWLGELLGFVGRHAVGWFSAIMAGGLAVLVLNFVQEPHVLSMIVRLRTGLLPTATSYGIVAATIVETGLTMLEIVLSGLGSQRSAGDAAKLP
ncbi:MAG: hypothetical protein JSS02_30855, partial [Planctomycetes bacterium]|nr:hypothetical protein [Planctomycetota bacterium]